jgi:hypothetical protein
MADARARRSAARIRHHRLRPARQCRRRRGARPAARFGERRGADGPRPTRRPWRPCPVRAMIPKRSTAIPTNSSCLATIPTAEAGFREFLDRYPATRTSRRRALLARRGAARPEPQSRRGRDFPCRQPRLPGFAQGSRDALQAWRFACRRWTSATSPAPPFRGRPALSPGLRGADGARRAEGQASASC